MFKQLRNRIIVISMLTTTTVLVIAFGAIYIVAASHAPQPQDLDFQYHTSEYETDEGFREQVREFITERVDHSHQESLTSLLISLIATGVFVEAMVFLLSLYLAEQSIRPIRDAYHAQKDFIANASHEIKTPLAAIQANLEAADIHNNHWIDNIELKTAELADLNNQLLTLARVESADIREEPTEVNLDEFITDFLTPLQPQISQKNLKTSIVHSKSSKTVLKLSKPALHQITGVLIDNAIKYASSKITIKVSSDSLTVSNDGATISSDQLPHVFERFYQTDKTSSGVGLGLAIAHQVARQNHWQLTCESGDPTTFTLKF